MQFGAMNKMELSPEPSLRDLAQIAVQNEPGIIEAGHDPEQVIEVSLPGSRRIIDHKFTIVCIPQATVSRLYDRREMLDEYFSLTITEEGFLKNIPMLLHDFSPDLNRLPFFILCAAMKVSLDRLFVEESTGR